MSRYLLLKLYQEKKQHVPVMENSNSANSSLAEEEGIYKPTDDTGPVQSPNTVTVATGASLWGLLSFHEKR